ncbi:hypothetical protein JHK87_017994 [Glycine soja]|nr:hypothetical protein JHK87_017994 [Glycine soja]
MEVFSEARLCLMRARSCLPNVENAVEEANSKPELKSRSHSNPKERKLQADKQAKKRLSRPNNGELILFLFILLLPGI